ncbi:MAG: SRPBCC domain-containing protein [Nitrosopumilus sp.]|nr:SRPBCC domain-containing protein [Nitrosopumilus sp.]MDH3385116.1 SRPBCC domain-containing protein [Nitrosopumilus sp.]
MSSKQIKQVVELDSSQEDAFKAISNPLEIIKWFSDAAILEPKVGGKFKITFLKDSKKPKMKMNMDFINEGKILEIIPNKKLVHTWKWNQFSDFPETIVTWELESVFDGKTRLTLTHTGFTGKEEGPASLEEHTKGWTFFLNELISYCKN